MISGDGGNKRVNYGKQKVQLNTLQEEHSLLTGHKSFTMVVFEHFFSVQSEFSFQNTTKKLSPKQPL